MLYFFDTSALQHRYIDGPKARGIRKTISDKRNQCFIADLTIIEIASTFALHCRKNGESVTSYVRLDQAFWNDILHERILVRHASQRDFLRARDLLRHAGVEKSKNIKTVDALIAACCLEFALERKASVVFCLEDWTLYQVIRDVSAYDKVLDFRFIGVDKSRK